MAESRRASHRAGQELAWPADCPAYAFDTQGREASAYLQFIVDHWEALPATMLFLHAHECVSLRSIDAEQNVTSKVASFWEPLPVTTRSCMHTRAAPWDNYPDDGKLSCWI